jgi:hypothetical protein
VPHPQQKLSSFPRLSTCYSVRTAGMAPDGLDETVALRPSLREGAIEAAHGPLNCPFA